MGICDQRVVIVTGAGGGLGAAHARVLASEGAAVLVNDINTEAAR
ncbi:MAG: SDR family NAD(P)-dependent oxidoreductase, partial [Pseudomonadota bacterium]|nr:SDR family NAD(P)-dependent oxidoreductase [Pseudomonadota bacterium]